MTASWIPAVRVAGVGEAENCIDTLRLAFGADPGVRWLYPEAHQYLAGFAGFAQGFGGGAFAAGSAFYIDGHIGTALWLPPGIGPDEAALLEHLDRTVRATDRSAIFAAFAQMSDYHPDEPHWYLPLIGVDPMLHGHGYGSRLLTHALARCDADGTPAYLESSNVRNIPLYERHGFRVLGTIRIGDGPPITPMLRRPAS